MKHRGRSPFPGWWAWAVLAVACALLMLTLFGLAATFRH